MIPVVEDRAVEDGSSPDCVPVGLAQAGGVRGIGPLRLDGGVETFDDLPGVGSRQSVVGGCCDTHGEPAAPVSIPTDVHGLGRGVDRTHLWSQVEGGREVEGLTVPEHSVVAGVVVVVADGDVEDDPLEELATDLLGGETVLAKDIEQFGV